MLHTLAHELVHHVRDWSPEKYKILADFLMEQYGKKGVSVDELVHRQIEKAKANGRTLTYAQAHEEVVADSMETMLADGTLIEKLRILSIKDKGIVAKIESFLKNLVAKIRKAYEGLRPDSQEGRIVAEMIDTSEQLHQLFADAIAGASENFKNAEVDASEKASSKNKFSLKGINENGIEVYETSEDVLKLPWKERKTRYLDLMKNEFRGRTAKFERNGHYYYAEFDRKSLSKAVYGEKRSDKKGHDALVNIGADGDVFDLVENSRYTGSEVDKKNHPKADYFDYFVKTVQINNTVFDVLADVQKQYGKNGGYVYTIKLTENKSVKASPIREGQETSLKNSGNALTDETRIPQNGTDVNTSISENGVKYSDRDYSYDALVSKPDMKVTTLYDFDQHDRKDVVKEAKKNATSVGKANSDGSVSVYVNDIDREVIVSTKAIRHSLDSRSKVNIPVVLKIGEILKNSIKINELNPREENISQSYVLMGMAKNPNNEPYIVSFVVNSYTNTIDTVDVLYSANAKKEPAGIISPRVSTPSTGSAISIRLLLDFVNKYFSDILPEDVLRHYGYVSRPDGKLGESALFSDRDPNALTPRNLLANALEESAVHEVEKKKLAEYKENIEKLYEKEQELYEVRKEIKKLSFAPGKKDTAKIKKLQEKAVKLSNSVTFYDKKLLNLESTSFLKNVLEREKKNAIKRQKEKQQFIMFLYHLLYFIDIISVWNYN